jgi:hypothetical protein
MRDGSHLSIHDLSVGIKRSTREFDGTGHSNSLLDLAPGGVYPAPSFAVGTVRSYFNPAYLRDAPFHPYPDLHRDGIVSVALSCFPKNSGRSRVTGHLALRSSDFPLRLISERLPDQLQYISSSKLRRISLSFSSQYNIRPQNSQRIKLFPARISTIFWGGTTLEHPPQET